MNLHPSPQTPHLILGGARSGKSQYAESLLQSLPPPYLYVATAQALDGEMDERIRLHRLRRAGSWKTHECPHELPKLLEELEKDQKPVLVDCVTLWLSNLLAPHSPFSPEAGLNALAERVSRVTYPLFLVSNEVGGGIVPDNPLARRFRDLAGKANQELARASRSVTLVVAGLPLPLKHP